MARDCSAIASKMKSHPRYAVLLYVALVSKYTIFSYFLCIHNSVLPVDSKINFKIKYKHIADPMFDDDRDVQDLMC